MPLTREDKQNAISLYKKQADSATNVVLLLQKGIGVNDINELRKQLVGTGGKLQVIKKRLFLRAMADAGMEGVDLGVLDGSVMALFASWEDEFAPLKTVNKINKQFKSEKKKVEIEYLWAWFEKSWKDADYIKELASLPSKEELVWKFLFLLNHPVQSLAATLKAVAEKKETETN